MPEVRGEETGAAYYPFSGEDLKKELETKFRYSRVLWINNLQSR
jgi:hypothetical protein